MKNKKMLEGAKNMWTYHYDHVYSKWNVFCDGQFRQSFDDLKDAQDFCAMNNWRES